MEIIIRKAVPSDAEQIGRVHYTAFVQTYGGMLPKSVLSERSADKSTEIFKRSKCRDVIVCEESGTVVGFCGFGAVRAEDRAAGEIYGIYLLRDYQRRRLGSKMLATALGELESRGYTQAVLWVLEENRAAIEFYEKLGFQYSGESKAEYKKELLYVKIFKECRENENHDI